MNVIIMCIFPVCLPVSLGGGGRGSLLGFIPLFANLGC